MFKHTDYLIMNLDILSVSVSAYKINKLDYSTQFYKYWTTISKAS